MDLKESQITQVTQNTQKLMFAFLVLLSLAGIAALLSTTASADLQTFFDQIMDNLETQGRDFVDGSGNVVGTVGYVPTTVYEAFKPASCGNDWAAGGIGLIDSIQLWLAPAVFVGLVVMIGVACLYMFGQLLSAPNLIAMAKDEMFQTGLTFFRVAMIAAMLFAGETVYTVSTSTSQDPIYLHHPQMIDAAMAFSRQMVSDISTHYSVLLIYNMVVHTIYSSTMWVGISWRSMYSFNMGPVLRPIIDVLGTALQFLSLGMSEWLVYIITLCLIKKYMWSLFIPLGMLMRAFPYTRSAGESLLALSFALVLFYPFMFIFSYETHKIMGYNLTDAKAGVKAFISETGINGALGSVLVIMMLMGGVFIPFFLGGALTLALGLIKNAVYYVVVMSVLVPFINIFVTLTAAREIARFFNTDVNFMSFLKII